MTNAQNSESGDYTPLDLSQPLTNTSTAFINEIHDYLRERVLQPAGQSALSETNENAFFASALSPLAPAADRPGPEAIATHIRNLDSGDFATREEASRQLANLRIGALPEIVAARRNPGSLEVRTRCDELISRVRNEGLAQFIDEGLRPAEGLSPRDRAIREAALNVMRDTPAGDLVQMLNRASPQQYERLREAIPPQSMRGIASTYISSLDNDSFQAREEASRQLARLGVAALPEIYEASRNGGIPLEVRLRCDQLVNRYRTDGIVQLIDEGLKPIPPGGLSPRDQAIRDAAEDILNDMPTADLLVNLGRHSLDITGQRLERLRGGLSRQTMQDIRVFEADSQFESDYRAHLGRAMLTRPDRVQKLQGRLAECLLRSGSQHDAEAGRLLESATQQPDCPSEFHVDLATIRHRQNDPQSWLTSARAYMRRLEQGGLGPVELNPTRELERQSFDMLASNQFTAEQRAEVESMQSRINDMINRYRADQLRIELKDK